MVIAPGRAKRPGASRPQLDPPTAEELESCPFCAGHEEMTPPQTLVLPEDGDWRVRVVPNLYPALERVTTDEERADLLSRLSRLKPRG